MTTLREAYQVPASSSRAAAACMQRRTAGRRYQCGRAGGHRPAFGALCVDEGGIVDEPQGVQLLLVSGIGLQPIYDRLFLCFRGSAVDIFV